MNNLKRIAVVTACMTHDGLPTFVLNEVQVTQEQLENGIHYYLVESDLLMGGYDEPFVHFDQNEAPPFLHAAVRQTLAPTANGVNYQQPILVEAIGCPA